MTVATRAQDYQSPEDVGMGCAEWRTLTLDARISRLRAVRWDFSDQELGMIADNFDRACAANRSPLVEAMANGFDAYLNTASVRPAGQQFIPTDPAGAWLRRMNVSCPAWLALSPAEQDARILSTAQASGRGLSPTQAHEVATLVSKHCRVMTGQVLVTPTGMWLPLIPQGADPFHPVAVSPIIPLYPATYPYFGSAWWRVRSAWFPYLLKDFPKNWPVNWPIWTGTGLWLREGPIAGTAIRTTAIQNRPGMLTPAAYRASVP